MRRPKFAGTSHNSNHTLRRGRASGPVFRGPRAAGPTRSQVDPVTTAQSARLPPFKTMNEFGTTHPVVVLRRLLPAPAHQPWRSLTRLCLDRHPGMTQMHPFGCGNGARWFQTGSAPQEAGSVPRALSMCHRRGGVKGLRCAPVPTGRPFGPPLTPPRRRQNLALMEPSRGLVTSSAPWLCSSPAVIPLTRPSHSACAVT
jgi:hypothetical protein